MALPVEDYQRRFIIAAVNYLGVAHVRRVLVNYGSHRFVRLTRDQRRAFLTELAWICIGVAQVKKGEQ